MANILLDTNIIVSMIRNQDFKESLYKKYDLFGHDLIISVVTEGELWSLALQWDWGTKRKQMLAQLLQSFIVYPIRVQSVIKRYAEIDAYRQGKWREKGLPLGVSARNMGKNDIWIAATASVLQARLLSLDNDFLHLDDIFLLLEKIDLGDKK